MIDPQVECAGGALSDLLREGGSQIKGGYIGAVEEKVFPTSVLPGASYERGTVAILIVQFKSAGGGPGNDGVMAAGRSALLFEVEYIVHHIEDPRYLIGGQGGMNDFEQEVRRGCFSNFVICVTNQ